MEVPLLQDVAIIFALSIGILLGCHRIHLPNVVGFLLTGILCGPYGLQLVAATSDVKILAEIGIVLLLFTVGLEFSFKKIIEYKRYFLIAGTLQVVSTVVVSALIVWLIGASSKEALFLGFLICLSSTAIVLRQLSEKMQMDTPHGKIIVGIMIFQDIAAIPMMLLIPLLAGSHADIGVEALLQVAKGLCILALIIFSGAKIVPWLLNLVAKTRNKELFLLTVLTLCTSVAWMTASMGLSLSLGAFLAGLIIADSDYSIEAIGDILPFQDIFTSFFFVSIGMLLDVQFFLNHPILIVSLAMGVLLFKILFTTLASLALKMPLRTLLLTAIAISQIGEFSFVLARSGTGAGLGSPFYYQLFLAVSLLTMAVTPSLMQLAPKLVDLFLKLPLPIKLKTGFNSINSAAPAVQCDHTIIIGFGVTGRNLARSAREAQISYLILETNPETVKQEKAKGQPIHFGDATHENVLYHMGLAEAKVLAVVINDLIAAARIVKMARQLHSHLHIIVRTRYLEQMKEMYKLGADEVIPDEFGSSVEVFTRVLRQYHTPNDEIQKIITSMHIEGYEMLRLHYQEPTTLSDLQMTLSDIAIENFRLYEGSCLAYKTLSESGLKGEYGVTVMLIKRGKETLSSLNANLQLLPQDSVIVVGHPSSLKQVAHLFKAEATATVQPIELPV